jgi:drug/metabolite transporter (DMT)-like permease
MFATNIMVSKIAAARIRLDIGYLIAVTVNVLVAALLLGIDMAARGRVPTWDGGGVLLFMGAGLFSTYLGRWFILESIARLGPAKASAFQVSSPLFTAAIAWLALGEHLGAVSIAGIATAIVGLLLVSLPGRRTAAPTPAPLARPDAAATSWQRWFRSGLALGIGSSAAYAVGNVFRGAAIRHWNELVLGVLIGAMTGLALQLALGRGHSSAVRNLRAADRRGVQLFALSGVLTIAGQLLTVAAMAFTPVAVVSLITLCTPLLVFPASYFLLRNEEGIGVRTLAGGVLTLAGIAAVVLTTPPP